VVRYSQDIGFLRLGAFVYTGSERSEGLADDILIWGPDATVSLGNKAEVNLGYYRRTDSNPFFLTRCQATDYRCDAGASDPYEIATDAGMLEVLYYPQGAMGRWFFTGLVNWIESDRQALSLRLGEQDLENGYLDRYTTYTLGTSYVWKRNLRALAEYTWDAEAERNRFTLGVVTAF
jgi:hypothetical protein